MSHVEGFCLAYICSGWFLSPRLIERIYKHLVTWLCVALLAYLAYYLLNHKTVYIHLTFELLGPERSHNIIYKVKEKEELGKV